VRLCVDQGGREPAERVPSVSGRGRFKCHQESKYTGNYDLTKWESNAVAYAW
jgi:hypothetical protein